MYMAFGAGSQAIKDSKYETYDQLNFDDLNVLLLGFTHDLDVELENRFDNVDKIEKRLLFYTTVKIEDNIMKCVLVGINSSQYPGVDTLLLREGEYFNDTGANNTDVLMIKAFVDYHNLLNKNLSFYLGDSYINLTIRASVSSPEYIYVLDPDMYMAQGDMGVAYFDIEFLRDLLNLPKDYSNNLVMTFKDDSLKGDTMDDIHDYLENNYEYILNWISSEDNPSNMILEEETSQWEPIANTMGIFFLFVSFVIIFSTMTRYVFDHKRQIGTLKSIGIKSRHIMFDFLKFVSLLWIISAIIGFLLGYYLGEFMLNGYLEYFDLPYPVYSPSIQLISITLFSSLGITLSSPLYALYRISKTLPADALQSAKKSTIVKGSHVPFLERVIRVIKGGPVSSTTRIALRNVFLKKKRTFFLILSLVFGFTLSATILYFTNSVFSLIDHEISFTETWDYQIAFTSNQYGDDSQIATISEMNKENIIHLDPYVSIAGRFYDYKTGEECEDFIRILGIYTSNSQFRHKNLIEGNFFTANNTNEIIIGINYGLKINVGIGDYIQFFAGSSLHTMEVIGFHDESSQFKAYVPLECAQSMLDLPENKFSGLYVKCNNSKNEIETQITLIENSFDNTAVLAKEAFLENALEQERYIFGLLIVSQGIAIVISFLIITNILNVNIQENTIYWGLLKTQGYKKRSIFKVILIENILLIILMLVFGSIVGYFASVFLLNDISDGMIIIQSVFSWDLTIFFVIEGFVVSIVSLIPGTLSAIRLDTKNLIREKLAW